MPSRRSRKIMKNGVTNAVTLERGGKFWQDFPGDTLCTCGHLRNRHVMNLADHGGCTEFDGTKYCPCKKFEKKETI